MVKVIATSKFQKLNLEQVFASHGEAYRFARVLSKSGAAVRIVDTAPLPKLRLKTSCPVPV